MIGSEVIAMQCPELAQEGLVPSGLQCIVLLELTHSLPPFIKEINLTRYIQDAINF